MCIIALFPPLLMNILVFEKILSTVFGGLAIPEIGIQVTELLLVCLPEL